MNPIATELNAIIEKGNPHIFEMLSDVGKQLFFPKGILSQSAEAKQKAHKFNATIGIATEGGKPMGLPSILNAFEDLPPANWLTYAPSFGLPDLRKAWKESLYEKNQSLAGKSVSLPVVTQAITHGIALIGDMWIDPGDTIIVPDMWWGNYNLILGVRRGAKFATYPLFTAEGGFDTQAFDAAVKKQAAESDKVIVLLNFPNNPTGYTPLKEEGEAIAKTLKETAQAGTNVLALFDDAYFGLFFEESSLQESLFAQLADADERLMAVKLDGHTKEDFVWGLRVGFITYGIPIAQDQELVYEALEKKTAGAARGSISNASHLSQTLMIKAAQSPDYAAEKNEKRQILQDRALKVKEVLANEKYADAWEPYPFNSGYFMCLKLKTVDAETLRVHILDKYGVGLISLGKTDLRVAFSCLEKDNVQELFDIVYQGVKDLE